MKLWGGVVRVSLVLEGDAVRGRRMWNLVRGGAPRQSVLCDYFVEDFDGFRERLCVVAECYEVGLY